MDIEIKQEISSNEYTEFFLKSIFRVTHIGYQIIKEEVRLKITFL